MDRIDKQILKLMQSDLSLSKSEIAEQVGLSVTPCWRRVQNLENQGIIAKRVALLDPEKLNLGVSVYVMIKTNQHNASWLEKFASVVYNMPEVAEFYRMSGDIDYMMRVVVPDIQAYDNFYQKLIKKIDLYDISSCFSMECIKYTTELPLDSV